MRENVRKMKFEVALKKLEKLTEEIEQGEIGLEESIARYEQGMALVARCREILEQAELRIQKLTASGGESRSTGAPEADVPSTDDSADAPS